jgi:hypothetical protein
MAARALTLLNTLRKSRAMKAAALLLVLNEIRGLVLAGSFVWAWFG